MNYLWKIVRTTMAVFGGLLILGAVGTSDYYLLELEQPEPTSVVPTIIVGLLMMVPTVIHLIYRDMKEKEQ